MSDVRTAEARRIINAKMLFHIFDDARTALAELSFVERLIHIFWLLGPIILLIERSPADFWLSLCGLLYLLRCVFRKEIDFLNYFWVRMVLVFWAICLISAALSENPFYSLGEAFSWIRFPLFAAASFFWLGRDRRILYAMATSLFAGMLMMSIILLLELVLVGQVNGRLSWPYGDLVPGNYLAKATLPAFTFMVAWLFHYKNTKAFPIALVAVFTFVMSIFAGERMNFIIRSCAGLMAGLVWKPQLVNLILIFFTKLAAVMTAFYLFPYIKTRFIDLFLGDFPTVSESAYVRVWNGAVEAIFFSPFLGIGPDNYRMMCQKININSTNVDCNTHPHNYYLQLAAETGFIGLTAGLIMLGSIIWYCYRARGSSRENILAATSFVVPLAFFFPIQSTADFFGQWNNIFMWTAIGFSLACARLGEVDDPKATKLND